MVTLSDIQIADIFNALTETERMALIAASQAYDDTGALVDIGTPWAMGFEQEVQPVEYCD